MKRWKRLFYYLLFNVLVSACTVVAVLTLWERTRPSMPVTGGLAATLLAKIPSQPVATKPLSDSSPLTPESPTATSTFLVIATQTPSSDQLLYQVKAGDTLGDIAEKFEVGIQELIDANNITDPNRLEIGQTLIIPQPTVVPPTSTASPTLLEPTPTFTPTPVQTPGAAQVVIDRVVGAGDLAAERVVIRRLGAGELSMVGWQLVEGGGKIYTFPQLILFAGGAVNIHTRAGQDTVVDLFWGLDASVWQTGEQVVLRDAQGQVQATFVVP